MDEDDLPTELELAAMLKVLMSLPKEEAEKLVEAYCGEDDNVERNQNRQILSGAYINTVSFTSDSAIWQVVDPSTVKIVIEFVYAESDVPNTVISIK